MLTFTIAALLFARAVNTIEAEWLPATPDIAPAPTTLEEYNDCMNAPNAVFDDNGNCVYVPPPYTNSSSTFPIDCVNVPNCQIINDRRDPRSNECLYYNEPNFGGLAISLRHAPPRYDTGKIKIANIYEDILFISSIKCGSDAMAISELADWGFGYGSMQEHITSPNQKQSYIGYDLQDPEFVSRVIKPGSSPTTMPSPPYPPSPWPFPHCPTYEGPDCTSWSSFIWTSTNNLNMFLPGNTTEDKIASLEVPYGYELYEIQYDISNMLQLTDDVWYGPDQREYNYVEIVPQTNDVRSQSISYTYYYGQCYKRSHITYWNVTINWLYCYVG